MKKEIAIRHWLILGCLILLAVVSTRYFFRLDLTVDRAYTLSPYTRECLKNLDSEVTVSWYRSASLSRLTPTIRYIEDFLEEYRQASSGAFSFSVIDPVGQNRLDTIKTLGLVSRQVEIPQQDGLTTKDLYSGLVIEYKGQSRVIPFLLDVGALEYDLTRSILELESARKVSGTNTLQLLYGRNPENGEYQYLEPWITYAGYTIRKISLPADSLDASLPLLVIGSSNIDNLTAQTIIEFMKRGGNAAFFVSGNTVNASGDWIAKPKTNDSIIALLETNYGIAIRSALVLDISCFRITMPALDNSKNEFINYPFWITALLENMHSDTSLLSGVGNLQFFWPSPIYLLPDAPAVMATVSTTADSINMQMPYDTDPFGKQLSLFAEKNSTVPAFLAIAASPKGRLIAVADEYLPSTLIEYTGSDSNLDFVVNCVEWISGKDRLLELKNQARAVPDARQSKKATTISRLKLSRIVNLAVVPGLLACISLILMIRRKKTQ